MKILSASFYAKGDQAQSPISYAHIQVKQEASNLSLTIPPP